MGLGDLLDCCSDRHNRHRDHHLLGKRLSGADGQYNSDSLLLFLRDNRESAYSDVDVNVLVSLP